MDQWLAYRAVPKPNGKINKPPIDAKTGESGSSTNPATWSSYELAAKRSPVGAAFVLTLDDQYFAIDLDQCRDPGTGDIEPWALDVVNRFPMYWEVSYSHGGLRGIGRGVIPKDGCKKGNIEVYDHARLVVMTGRTLPGHETIRNCQQQLTKWHNEVWPREPEQPKRPVFTFASTDTNTRLTNEQILEIAFRAQNGDIIRRLHDGDISGYPESQSDPGFSSEADLALVSRLALYTNDDAMLADLWRGSGLYRKKLDRSDYVQRTIQKARASQSDAYSPGYASRNRTPEPPPRGAPCDVQLAATRAELAEARQSIIVLQDRVRVADERRIAAEGRAERLSLERSKIMEILRNPDLGTGEKLTHFTTVIDLGARIANGEEQAPQGFRLPAVRIAEQTGQSVQTVRKHWKNLTRHGVLDKRNVRERTEANSVDPETGEITTATGMRDVSHIHVPESNILHLIVPAASYERPEQETGHGGTRTPKPVCDVHPEAGTLTRTVVECAECHQELSRSAGTYEAPAESSGINLIGEPAVTNTLLRATKMIGESARRSPTKMKGEPPLDDDPPETTDPPPNWEDEHRRVYGQLYRGDVAS